MQEAELETLAALGMREDGDEILLSAPPDELRDYKVVFIGAAAAKLCGRLPRSASPGID